ncbi:hypothetical protein MMC22_009694 [Lobaria immixta]|nr:hypothetical protein [Lobaria immixta]
MSPGNGETPNRIIVAWAKPCRNFVLALPHFGGYLGLGDAAGAARSNAIIGNQLSELGTQIISSSDQRSWLSPGDDWIPRVRVLGTWARSYQDEQNCLEQNGGGTHGEQTLELKRLTEEDLNVLEMLEDEILLCWEYEDEDEGAGFDMI